MLDDRYFPVVVATWVGEVTDQGVDAYFRWVDRVLRRAAAEGVAVVPITDLRQARGQVATALRHRFVEEADRREAMTREYVDQVMVVAQGAHVLGLVAFILRRMRRGVRLSSCGDLRSALQRALQRLDLAGVTRPSWLDPASYERSVPSQAA